MTNKAYWVSERVVSYPAAIRFSIYGLVPFVFSEVWYQVTFPRATAIDLASGA